MSFLQTAAVVGSLAASVSAHGYVQGIVAAGKFYTGYNPSFQYYSPPPTVIGWSDPEDLGNGFIDPQNYTTPEIICHLGATPGGASASVAAGDVVELQWTAWPDSHHGPVITYLANCNGKCETVDKTTLDFVKIDAVGLVDDSDVPGTWGTDQLIANNNSWAVTIPKSIKAGNYVLRHEIIALHSAGTLDGAQNYPQCINLEITGSGTDSPAGTKGEKLYTPTEPGISINIYESLSTYKIPGPTLYSGAVSMKQTEVKINGNGTPATAAAVSASAATPASSAVATSTSTAAVKSQVDPVVSSSAASSASAISILPSITAAIPSSALTSVIPTALPTGALPSGGVFPSQAGGFNGSAVPTKPLPKGFTLEDLLQWVDYLMATMFKDLEKTERKHARDLKAVH